MKSGPLAATLLVSVLLAATSHQARAQGLRHLFLDPALLKQAQGAALHVNPPERRETVIHADQPWEGRMISLFLTVLDEGQKVRMWYICRDAENRPNLAYAESDDGVAFRKPSLGIVDYHGSQDNNLVGITSLEGAVFRDPQAKPGEEYVYVTHVSKHGIVRYCSPDGLHWRRDPKPLLAFRADTQNLVFWDQREGRYVLYLRGWDVAGPWEDRLRKVVRLTLNSLSEPAPIVASGHGDDPRHPSLPRIADEIPTVLRADDRDPKNCDVYNISAQPYPLDPRWYVGFPSFLQREKSISDGRVEVQFAGSRDGIAWHRYDRRPYALPGLLGSETGNVVFMGTGLVVRGDELWQYGVGLRSRHGDMAARKQQTDGVILRYVQRVDGFVSLDFDLQGGQAVAGPVKVDGPRLLLNVDTGALGCLRAGLRDEDGRPIPGFDVDDCDVIRTNSTHAVVGWKAGSDLSTFQGRSLDVVFSGSRAKLFSFFFQSDDTR